MPHKWVAETPIKTKVVLNSNTYNNHVLGDHETDLSRRLSYPYVKGAISNPKFIYYDQDYESNRRIRFIDLVAIPELKHLQALVVVVETDRDPQEVVTWMIKRSLKQERITGGVIYDSSYNKQDRYKV